MSAAVLLVIDHPETSRFLETALQHAGFVVLVSRAELSVLEGVKVLTPDLVLLDATGGGDIVPLLRYFNLRKIPCLIIPGEAPPAGVHERQLLLPPLTVRHFVARVEAELNAQALSLQGKVLQVSDLSLDTNTQEVHYKEKLINLGPKEFDFLQLLMTNPGRVFSRDQLLSKVWGDDVFNNERTVDVLVRRLRIALEAVGVAERLETVRGRGYRLRA